MEQVTPNVLPDRPVAPAPSGRRLGPGAAREKRTGGSRGSASRESGLFSSTMEQAIKEAIDRAMGPS